MTTTTQIAVITGGSRGLGRNAALALAKRGVGVVLTYQSKKSAADDTVRELEKAGVKAVALQLDTGKAGSFGDFAGALKQTLKATWGREQFDYLLNNAGMGVHKAFAETSEADFDALMNVHLKGPFFLTQKLLPLLADGGSILNVSTGLARFTLPGYAAYATMKGGIEVLTRYLAKELGPRGISVNTIAPGATATDFSGGAVRDTPQLQAMIASTVALGRVGQADDIGPVMASLLSRDNHWMTGQRVEASGGQNL